jgi:hypothetical protein
MSQPARSKIEEFRTDEGANFTIRFGLSDATQGVQVHRSCDRAGRPKERVVGILIVVLVVLAIIALLVFIFRRR